MRGSVLLVVVGMPALLGMFACDSYGQGVLTGSDQTARAEAYYRTGTTFFGNYGLVNDLSGSDFWAVEDRLFGFNGFSGRGYAEHGATFTPSSPLIGGSFSSVVLDACTSAEIFSAATMNSEDRAYGLARGEIVFDVLTAQSWSWTGAWQGLTYDSGAFYRVSGEISLLNNSTGGYIVNETRSSLNGFGDWIEPIAFGGVLNPGTYTLTWSHESIVANGFTPWGFFGVTTGGAPLVSCVNSTFSLVPAPGSMMVLGFGLVLTGARRR